MDNTLCGCGKPGKYAIDINTEQEAWSCNKYKRCMDYDELSKKYIEAINNFKKMKDIAFDLSIYRESTVAYNLALSKLGEFMDENG